MGRLLLSHPLFCKVDSLKSSECRRMKTGRLEFIVLFMWNILISHLVNPSIQFLYRRFSEHYLYRPCFLVKEVFSLNINGLICNEPRFLDLRLSNGERRVTWLGIGGLKDNSWTSIDPTETSRKYRLVWVDTGTTFLFSLRWFIKQYEINILL